LLNFENINLFISSECAEFTAKTMATHTSEPLLLVDGYNVIGAWSSLKKQCDRHGLESARYQLIETLINYTSHQGYRTQIVFDSQYQDSPGTQEAHTSCLSVYYTAFEQTADTYIEKICASQEQRSQYPRIIVATSDRAQKLTVMGYGAEWMSAQRLELEIDQSLRRIRNKQRPTKVSQGRFLVNSLDAKVQQKLNQLRHGIYQR
jgi:predicted RNA-binding protein with PIN domain